MKRIEINCENVKELWGLYEEYLTDFRERHYSNIEPMYFEQFVEKEIEYCDSECKYEFKSEMFYCENCGYWYMTEEKGSSELALQDNICEYCMEDGYGK